MVSKIRRFIAAPLVASALETYSVYEDDLDQYPEGSYYWSVIKLRLQIADVLAALAIAIAGKDGSTV
jgi:hypothetical protein